MTTPERVLKMIEEWARESYRNRPDKAWTSSEILEKVLAAKEKCDWELWRCETKKLSRTRETTDRHPSDPTPEQILEMCTELRAKRTAKQAEASASSGVSGLRVISGLAGYVVK